MYQIVFSTRGRERALNKADRDKLFQYIIGILKNKKCHVYRVNGIEDHIHILTHIHPTIALSHNGAFTYSITERDRLIAYVMNQEQHHAVKSFQDEYRNLLKEHNIEFDERYLP